MAFEEDIGTAISNACVLNSDIEAIHLAGASSMYYDAQTELVSWFHALDHTNYARCIPVHLRDMADLSTKNPEIAK